MYETKLKEGYLIPATFDIIFKELFTSFDTRDYTSSVLSNITGIPKDDLKNNMVILNNELEIENYKDKKMRTDILIKIEKSIINLEVNKYYYEGLFEKNNAYQNKLVSDQFYARLDYYEPKTVIQINFDDFNRFNERPIIKFEMADLERGLVEDENLVKYHIVLPNLRKLLYNKDNLSKFDKELLLLAENNSNKLKSLVGDDKGLMEIFEKREKLSQDKKIIGLYDGEKMDAYEERCKIAYAKKQGMEQGEQKKQQEIARNMLNNGISDELIISCTNLSLEELERLK